MAAKKDTEKTKESFVIFTGGFPSYERDNLKAHEKPSIGNSDVRIDKYRITIEKIPESDSDLISRLKQLYLVEDNCHNTEAVDNYCRRKFGKSMREMIAVESDLIADKINQRIAK